MPDTGQQQAEPYRSRFELVPWSARTALDHWLQSRATNPPPGDLAVLAVVAKLRELRTILLTGGQDAATIRHRAIAALGDWAREEAPNAGS